MVLVDTSVWIDALRRSGSDDLRQRLHALVHAGEAAWCAAVRLELWPSIRDPRERRILAQFRTVVADLPMAEAVWERAMELAERARSKGLNCPYPDLLIQACAIVHQVELLHRDKHFDALAKL